MNVQRYDMLDALRGIAALAVVGFHLSQFGMIPAILPRGYLAVDFFFVLSGFVVAHAYEQALRTNLSLRSFIVKRIIRLYPLALLGAMSGLLVLLLKWWLFPGKVDSLGVLLTSGALNLALVPSFVGASASSHDIFPGNGPLWSLFFELSINLLWAIAGIWLRTSSLITIMLVSLILLALFASYHDTFNIGYDTKSFWGGLARVCFGFPFGVVIYRERHQIRRHARQWGNLVLAAALIGVFAIPIDLLPQSFPWADILLVSICLPAIVIFGISETSGMRAGYLLGNLSYPVYVLHFPVLLIMSGLGQSVLAGWNIHIIACLGVMAILALAWLAWRFYDEPLRKALTSIVSNGDKKRHQPQPSTELGCGGNQIDGEQANVRI
ncbi:acyltransferase [Phyllobacterium sp. SB3]|uniref:acyltransferase family protein n=1 Tax=Phyllobacterium sp. SB3 TaxID=3156073 RepID=UPI0032AE8385